MPLNKKVDDSTKTSIISFRLTAQRTKKLQLLASTYNRTGTEISEKLLEEAYELTQKSHRIDLHRARKPLAEGASHHV